MAARLPACTVFATFEGNAAEITFVEMPPTDPLFVKAVTWIVMHSGACAEDVARMRIFIHGSADGARLIVDVRCDTSTSADLVRLSRHVLHCDIASDGGVTLQHGRRHLCHQSWCPNYATTRHYCAEHSREELPCAEPVLADITEADWEWLAQELMC